MSITWRRLGFLGFMIPLSLWALAIGLGGINNMKAMRVAMVLAAVTVWIVGTKLNREGPDEEGEALHQAFGFPMQWSALIGVGGFFLTFA
jgi:hypothetical protein